MQYVNQYNSQNGMGNMGPPDAMPLGMAGPPNGMGNQNLQSYIYNTQQQSPPNVNGWKAFNPDPPPPPARPLIGRWVDAFSDIKPQDVAMDGQMHFFPQNDNSCIYAKFWNNNGQLLSFRFLPEREQQQQPAQQGVSKDISDIMKGYEIVTDRLAQRLESLEGAVTDIYNAVTQPSLKQPIRKEDV